MKRKIINYIRRVLNKRKYVILHQMIDIGRDKIIDFSDDPDYIRLCTFELIAHEINSNNIEGDVAELGVFRGEFAKHINVAFKNKMLYLFDTFEGFNNNDLKNDRENNFSSGVQDFKNTSVDIVLKKMKNPEKCVIKKGYFPGTAEGLEEKFAFVSIDTDLFDPIYEGLKYFYPRLSNGGYILIHDYNYKKYSGSNKAVKKFCSENNISCVPLCDAYGSAVIVK